MNDTQVLTLAISLIVPLSFLLLSNSRITDTKETLRAKILTAKTELQAEIQSTKTELRAEIQSVRAELQTARVEILNRFDRFEDNISRMLADQDHRIAKLEAERS